MSGLTGFSIVVGVFFIAIAGIMWRRLALGKYPTKQKTGATAGCLLAAAIGLAWLGNAVYQGVIR